MAAARSGSGGRHARHGGSQPAQARPDYRARHASADAGPPAAEPSGATGTGPIPPRRTPWSAGAESAAAWNAVDGRGSVSADPAAGSTRGGEAAATRSAGPDARGEPTSSDSTSAVADGGRGVPSAPAGAEQATAAWGAAAGTDPAMASWSPAVGSDPATAAWSAAAGTDPA